MYVLTQELTQGGRPAANVEKITISSSRDHVDDPCAFLQPKVRLEEFPVLRTPEILLVMPRSAIGAGTGDGIIVVGRVVHNHIRRSLARAL